MFSHVNTLHNTRDVKSEYKVLKEKVKEYNRKDAQFYGNIFTKMLGQPKSAVSGDIEYLNLSV